MIDDLAETRPILFLIAGLFWLSMIVSSFYNEDSPLQFRVLDCHVPHPTAAQCPVSLVWIGLR